VILVTFDFTHPNWQSFGRSVLVESIDEKDTAIAAVTGPDATVTITSIRELTPEQEARYRDREGRIRQWQQLAVIGQAYRGLL
jgi:hypothetical protein